MGIIQEAIKPLCLIKARKIERLSHKFISGKKVLDLGAGRCLIAREISRRDGIRVACVDVLDVNQTGMKLTLYDGRKLPFKAGEFDSVLIAYVLHHCDDPVGVLREAMRVCRGNIIIFEDTKMSPFEEAVDTFVNKINHEDINTPRNFRTEAGWLKIFKRLGLKVAYMERGVEKEWFYPFVEHTMFVVRK
jgi:ubiquinone/menaquinone biosynthesis C-methylase UbiE